jgi:hypothetical protein
MEIPQFFAQNSKHSPGSQFGALEVEIGPLSMGKPTRKAQQITRKETPQHDQHVS